MQIVEVTVRPARLAFAFSPKASSRVVRRAFRLAASRWGGGYDVMLCLSESADPFTTQAIRVADPDFILNLDPQLERFDWNPLLDAADRQPFSLWRFRERQEHDPSVRSLFRDSPILFSGEDEQPEVLDYEQPGASWRTVAIAGLLSHDARVVRVRGGSSPTPRPMMPSRRSIEYLSVATGEPLVAFFGEENDIAAGAHYWTLRALGARLAWLRTEELYEDDPPEVIQRLRPREIYLHSPSVAKDDLQAAADRWTEDWQVAASLEDLSVVAAKNPEPTFARQVVPVADHHGWLRFPTPPPPPLARIRPHLAGIASIRVLSPDPGDPDGVILARDEASRELVSSGTPNERRITASGVAELLDIAAPELIRLPLVNYADAVAAPLDGAGYSVSPSDKGRYQQRSLELAGGLLFLAWLLGQPESTAVLDLFFTSPPGARSGYRRAVLYDEMQETVRLVARGRRSRLRAPLRERADAWLRIWTSRLLERELLQAGYLLDCPRCASRLWYRGKNVDQRFLCARCDARSVVPATTARTFRLSEAFFQLREQGGHVVTFALARLRSEAAHSFLYLAETEVARGSERREVDALALVDGQLAVVEAKTGNDLSKREIEFYSRLARRTRAAQIIFVTTDRGRAQCGTAACPCGRAEDSRDYAWSDGAQARISFLREDLKHRGIAVTSWCADSLVRTSSGSFLEPFERHR